MRSFLQRVINIPEKLQTALLAALVFLAVQAEIALSTWLGIDLTGVVKPIAAALAVAIGFIAKVALERLVPVALHPVVNAFLVFLAGFLGALALLP